MREYPSLIGKRYGKLVVEQLAPSTTKGVRRWQCRCDCGGTCVVSTANLTKGHTKSCGCIKSPDLTGQRFGRLTVLGRSEQRGPRGKRTTPLWECQCDCGAITYKAKDTLTNPALSMCADCAVQYATEKARESAGFVDGTQITKIQNMKPTAANTSGCRGVYYDRKTNKYRARLRFKGKLMNFGTFERFEEAVAARKEAERIYYGAFLGELEDAQHIKADENESLVAVSSEQKLYIT